jgi:hypothetical protein
MNWRREALAVVLVQISHLEISFPEAARNRAITGNPLAFRSHTRQDIVLTEYEVIAQLTQKENGGGKLCRPILEA